MQRCLKSSSQAWALKVLWSTAGTELPGNVHNENGSIKESVYSNEERKDLSVEP